MLKSFNEKQFPALFAEARARGSEVGTMVREHGWVAANMTMARAATGWVNRQPLNNISLEKELHSAFLGAAEKAATAEA